jgi:large subunit ribosomal protein L35
MPKIKTHSGAKKRFKVTANGKIKRGHVGRRHILTKKNTKRLRHLRKEGFADVTNVAQVKRLLPYQ